MFNLKNNYRVGVMLEVVQLSALNHASEMLSIIFLKKGNKKKEALIGFMGDQKVYDFNLGTEEQLGIRTLNDFFEENKN
ncbi:MAG: hypothetical protein LH473_12275 [Chitinophagales bacterium]|nr:hypothetical protein [Chitinophagales bacterium]